MNLPKHWQHWHSLQMGFAPTDKLYVLIHLAKVTSVTASIQRPCSRERLRRVFRRELL